MSEFSSLATDIPRGLYKILSVAATDNPLTGILPIDPGSISLPVHVDAAIHVWEIKPEPGPLPGAYRLSLQSPFPYTGAEDRKVIVTDNPSKDKVWYIYGREEYVISSGPISLEPKWTLSSERPAAEIVLAFFEIPPEVQRFRIEPLPK